MRQFTTADGAIVGTHQGAWHGSAIVDASHRAERENRRADGGVADERRAVEAGDHQSKDVARVVTDFPIKPAKWFWGRCVLRPLGFAGITMPWAIYILPQYLNDPVLRAHELVHVEQMKRDGFMWWPMAGYYLLRYGYWNSPYEVEARTLAPQKAGSYWPTAREKRATQVVDA